jgi:hypothetical protein
MSGLIRGVSDIWPDKKGGLLCEWPYKRGTTVFLLISPTLLYRTVIIHSCQISDTPFIRPLIQKSTFLIRPDIRYPSYKATHTKVHLSYQARYQIPLL